MFPQALIPVMICLSGTAFAQQAPTPEQAANPAPSAAPGQTQTATDFRTSKLIGTNVYNNANENVGEIEELMVNSSGTITAAVVSVGGFLGMGERYVALPFKQLKIAREADRDPKVTTDATKDSLKGMAEYKFVN